MLLMKHLHLTFVVLSIAGFVLRGFWMVKDSPLLFTKPVKILPHIIDTVLLVSAIILAVQLGFNPANQPWLLAKIVALVLYIGLGVIALKPGRPKPIRVGAFALAIVCFMYIVSAALSKSALGFFA